MFATTSLESLISPFSTSHSFFEMGRRSDESRRAASTPKKGRVGTETKPAATLDLENPISVQRGLLFEESEAEVLNCEPALELSYLVRGEGSIHVGTQSAPWRERELFLGGPNEPRWVSYKSYPVEIISVRFLPSIINEWGQDRDALALLDRFLAGQDLEGRILPLPDRLRKGVGYALADMAEEFEKKTFGWKLRVQALLIEVLTNIVRWEFSEGRAPIIPQRMHSYWKPVLVAISYIRTHFSEPIYARQIESLTGLSEASLRGAFRETIGMSWIRFLERTRIQNAVLMLRDSSKNITEVAFAVGFESLSHFNRAFKSYTGLSPRSYLRKMENSSR